MRRPLLTDARLVLEAGEAVRIERSLPVLGLDALEPGAFVFWTDVDVFRVSKGGSLSRICPDDVHQPVAAAPSAENPSIVEVVEGSPPRILRSRSDSTCWSAITLDGVSAILAATAEPAAWMLLALDSAGDAELVTVRRTGETHLSTQRGLPGEVRQHPTEFGLTGAAGTVVLSHRVWPFDAHFLRDGDTTLKSVRPVLPVSERSPQDSVPFVRWTTVGAFPLDSGFLEVFADLRSDRRLLVLISDAGETTRVTQLDAPFGIAKTVPSDRRALVVRRTNVLELVAYRWRWLNAKSPR